MAVKNTTNFLKKQKKKYRKSYYKRLQYRKNYYKRLRGLP